MEIIREEEGFLCIYKPAGIAVQTRRTCEKDIYSEVMNYLGSKTHTMPYAAVINRLDQPVEGIVLFAKNRQAAANLSSQLQNGKIKKEYQAYVFGTVEKKQDSLTDYLKKNDKENRSDVVLKETPDAKQARLSYRVISQNEEYAQLQISLETGRHHQIRVQLSSRGNPILGDLKYGTEESIAFATKHQIHSVCLCASSLTFSDPVTKKQIHVTVSSKNNDSKWSQV